MFSYLSIFNSYSTSDLNATETFYAEILGLEVERPRKGFMHVYMPGGQPFVIYLKKDHQAADYTVLNLQVSNIKAVVSKLQSKGITFLDYSEPIQTNQQGISLDDQGSHLAWCKDPGGNIIAIIEN